MTGLAFAGRLNVEKQTREIACRGPETCRSEFGVDVVTSFHNPTVDVAPSCIGEDLARWRLGKCAPRHAKRVQDLARGQLLKRHPGCIGERDLR